MGCAGLHLCHTWFTLCYMDWTRFAPLSRAATTLRLLCTASHPLVRTHGLSPLPAPLTHAAPACLTPLRWVPGHSSAHRSTTRTANKHCHWVRSTPALTRRCRSAELPGSPTLPRLFCWFHNAAAAVALLSSSCCACTRITLLFFAVLPGLPDALALLCCAVISPPFFAARHFAYHRWILFNGLRARFVLDISLVSASGHFLMLVAAAVFARHCAPSHSLSSFLPLVWFTNTTALPTASLLRDSLARSSPRLRITPHGSLPAHTAPGLLSFCRFRVHAARTCHTISGFHARRLSSHHTRVTAHHRTTLLLITGFVQPWVARQDTQHVTSAPHMCTVLWISRTHFSTLPLVLHVPHVASRLPFTPARAFSRRTRGSARHAFLSALMSNRRTQRAPHYAFYVYGLQQHRAELLRATHGCAT